MKNLELIKDTVYEIKNRLYTDELDGVHLETYCTFYWLFECNGKKFFVLNDVWSTMDHPFSNKDIRSDWENLNVPFEMFNGENFYLKGVPCIGTNLYLEQLHCWDYSEFARLGWSKSFYRKVVKALYKRFEGYYGSNINEEIFFFNDDFIVLEEYDDEGTVYCIYGEGTEKFEDRMANLKSREYLDCCMERDREYKHEFSQVYIPTDRPNPSPFLDEDLPFNP